MRFRYAAWLLIPGFLFGLFLSLKTTLGLSDFGADDAQPLMIWYGVQAAGPGWIPSFKFTPDNWLLSVVPIDFLEFSLLGPRPALVIFNGWFIFAASVVVSGLIARALGAKRAGWLLPVVLVFMGRYAHQRGFVSYSVSHDVTNLFGLLSVLAFLQALEPRREGFAVVLLCLLAAGGVSDPWMLPAYILPVAACALLLVAFAGGGAARRRCGALFFIAMAAALLAQSRVFGLLGFVQHLQYRFGDLALIRANALVMARDLTRLFSALPSPWGGLLLLALAASFAIAVVAALVERNDLRHLALVLLAGASLGAVTLAIVLTAVPAADYAARFLLNFLYLPPLTIAVMAERHWRRLPPPAGLFLAVCAGVFMVSGLAGTLPFLRQPGLAIARPGAAGLMDFLKRQNLTYGYGPYWGAQANAVTALSRQKIKIRPLVFDAATGAPVFNTRGYSSTFWYTPGDAPAGQKTFFVIVDSDGEVCPRPKLCLDGLARAYGPPRQNLTHGADTILVWNHPLVGWRQDAVVDLALNTRLLFGQANPSRPPWPGWWIPEPAGAWSAGGNAVVLLHLTNPPPGDVDLLIDGHGYIPAPNWTQTADISANGQPVGTLRYDHTTYGGIRKILIPKQIIAAAHGNIKLAFDFHGPVVGTDLDERLSVWVTSMELEEAR